MTQLVGAITGVKRQRAVSLCSRVVEESRVPHEPTPSHNHSTFPGGNIAPPPRPSQLPQREGGRRAGTHPSREPSLPGEREERSTTEKFRGGIHPKKLCVSPRDMVKSRLKFISIHPY